MIVMQLVKSITTKPIPVWFEKNKINWTWDIFPDNIFLFLNIYANLLFDKERKLQFKSENEFIFIWRLLKRSRTRSFLWFYSICHGDHYHVCSEIDNKTNSDRLSGLLYLHVFRNGMLFSLAIYYFFKLNSAFFWASIPKLNTADTEKLDEISACHLNT